MKSVQGTLIKDDSFYERKKKSIDELMSYAIVKDFLKTYHLDRSYVESNWIDFLNYVDDYTICKKNCNGIESCPKNLPGYQRLLGIENGDLVSSYNVCPYGQELETKRRIMANIISNVPKDIFLMSFKDLVINTDKKIALGRLLLSHVIQIPKKGVYVYGDMGVGKSSFLIAFCNLLANKENQCAFISVPQMIQNLKNSFNSNDDNGLDELKEVEYLVLDDIGAESFSPWVRDEVLYNLLNDRLLRGKPTYFTSYFSLEDLEAHYRNNSKNQEDAIRAKRLLQRIRNLSDDYQI